jgi:Putative metallopeptidase
VTRKSLPRTFLWRLPACFSALIPLALIANAPPAIAQLPQPEAQIASGIEAAVKALDTAPQLKELSSQEKRRLVEFVTGNTLFVVAHELGHGVINELHIPVVGREEDAADSFAIVTALNMESRFSHRVLMEAAKGWFLSGKRDKKAGNALTFHGEHGLDLQRAYNIVCFMVGSDPEKYRSLAAQTEFPEHRQASCVYEWKNTSWSWEELLRKHLRSADQPKVAITVEYEETEAFAMHARVLRHMGLLEAFAEYFGDRYAWPRPLKFEARSCGMVNARWRQRVLTFCYELADYFVELYQDSLKTPAIKERDGG